MYLLLCRIGQHQRVSARQRGVADVLEQRAIHIREHADAHGVLHIDAAADAARHVDMLQHGHVHVQRGQHNVDGGENGALGPDEALDIHLGNGDLPAGVALVAEGQHVAPHAVLIPEDTAVLLHKVSLGGDGGGAVQLGDHVDDAASADTHRLLALLAHDGQCRLQRLPVDGHGLYRAVGGPHTAGNVAALKGGACGAGAGHHEVPVAKHDLAVGAQIDEQGELVLVPDAAGQRTGGDITAHIGADVGRQHHLGVRVGHKADIPGLQAVPVEERRNVRLHADGIGVHAQQQVVHGGVGGHAAPQDAVGIYLGAGAQRPR